MLALVGMIGETVLRHELVKYCHICNDHTIADSYLYQTSTVIIQIIYEQMH